MKNKIGKIWNIITSGVLIIMVVLVAMLFVPKLFGVTPLIVLSGSMEPNYPVGTLIYVTPIEEEKIEKGTVVTFRLDSGDLATHRVIRINDDHTFVTQGDNNNVEDAAVAYSRIVGSPRFQIKKLGFLADKLSTPSGKIIYGTIAISLVILMLIGDLIFKEKKSCEKEADSHEQ